MKMSTIISCEKTREIIDKIIKNNFYETAQDYGVLELTIGEDLDDHLEEEDYQRMFNCSDYEEFIENYKEEYHEMLRDEYIYWFETLDDAWEYYAADWIENEYESFDDYELDEFLKNHCAEIYNLYIIEVFNEEMKKEMKKIVKFDHWQDNAAMEIFSGVLSGNIQEIDEINNLLDKYCYHFSDKDFEFNADEEFISTLFTEEKLDMVNKSYASIIFSDIRDRIFKYF